MSRISFFAGSDWMQQNAINDARARADAAMEVAGAQADAFGSAISSLRGTVEQQKVQIKLLESMIGVLAAVLRDNKLIDPDMLDARLEAAVINSQTDARQEADTVRCGQCQQIVAKARSNMTEAGVICDRCLATSG